ncbi:MAG: tetratricopeptide repeat protein [Cyclobacteriaceae bacterium]|nr:tetratricopeptide repeat protein [Cyclobacteriaceae bacterium]MCH8517372.1 tetratricopeptide repeat protein [Cyclobacteriaceae bacterium]
MKVKMIGISLVGLVVVIILFTLPKTVVDNESEGSSTSRRGDVLVESDPNAIESPGRVDRHQSQALGSKDAEKVSDLKKRMEENMLDSDKSSVYVDLAEIYQGAQKFDSAAYFYDSANKSSGDAEFLLLAADNYYEAFTFALDKKKVQNMAQLARDRYESYLEINPDHSKSKNRIAMTYIAGDNPMQGILMLRELLEENPNDENAIYNLGLLSLQSNQPARAVERFEKLLELNPENEQAQFYYGVSLAEAGRTSAAIRTFESLKNSTEDPEVKSAAQTYLKDLR